VLNLSSEGLGAGQLLLCSLTRTLISLFCSLISSLAHHLLFRVVEVFSVMKDISVFCFVPKTNRAEQVCAFRLPSTESLDHVARDVSVLQLLVAPAVGHNPEADSLASAGFRQETHDLLVRKQVVRYVTERHA